jgi:hypothetical protein
MFFYLSPPPTHLVFSSVSTHSSARLDTEMDARAATPTSRLNRWKKEAYVQTVDLIPSPSNSVEQSLS